MCARSMSLFGIGVGALAAIFLICHTDTPRQRPAPPAMRTLSWQRIPTRRWPITKETIVLHFAPDEIGPPTLHTVVDAGADAMELWYLPWVHDDQNGDPLPSAYVDALAGALVFFGTQVDVIGKEGEDWVWDIRSQDVSPIAARLSEDTCRPDAGSMPAGNATIRLIGATC